MTLILRICPREAGCQCCAEDQGLLLRLSTGSLWGPVDESIALNSIHTPQQTLQESK